MASSRRYVVTVGGGPPRAVSLAFDAAGGGWTAEWGGDGGGERVPVSIERVDPGGLVHAIVGGRAIELRLEFGPDGEPTLSPITSAGAIRQKVRVRSDGELALASVAGSAPTRAPDPVLRAPITGVVLDVRVRLGDAVSAGDPVLVLEAMKMETVLRSPKRGRVLAVHVAASDRVRTGHPLVEIGDDVEPWEPPEDPR